MLDWLQILFSTTGFIPHGHCYLWKPTILGMHVVSDITIFLSYSVIPFALVWFVRQQKAFLLAGSLYYLVSLSLPMVLPIYWLTGLVPIASVLTAIVLFPRLPKALPLPSPTKCSRK
jgi:hypothetical protein